MPRPPFPLCHRVRSHANDGVFFRRRALVKYALAAESGLNLAQMNVAHLCEVNGRRRSPPRGGGSGPGEMFDSDDPRRRSAPLCCLRRRRKPI